MGTLFDLIHSFVHLLYLICFKTEISQIILAVSNLTTKHGSLLSITVDCLVYCDAYLDDGLKQGLQ